MGRTINLYRDKYLENELMGVDREMDNREKMNTPLLRALNLKRKESLKDLVNKGVELDSLTKEELLLTSLFVGNEELFKNTCHNLATESIVAMDISGWDNKSDADSKQIIVNNQTLLRRLPPSFLSYIGTNVGCYSLITDCSYRNRWGSNLAIDAILNNYLDVVIHLNQKHMLKMMVPVEKGLLQGLTPIFIASVHGDLATVKYLKEEYGANPNAPITEGEWIGMTPLSIASLYGHLDIAKYLSAEGGIDLNAPITEGIWEGETPIDIAFKNGRLDIVIEFLKAGVECNEQIFRSLTPNLDLVEIFIQRGDIKYAQDMINKLSRTIYDDDQKDQLDLLQANVISRTEYPWEGPPDTNITFCDDDNDSDIVKYLDLTAPITIDGLSKTISDNDQKDQLDLLQANVISLTEDPWEGPPDTYIAFRDDYSDIIKYLIECGADPTAPITIDRLSKTISDNDQKDQLDLRQNKLLDNKEDYTKGNADTVDERKQVSALTSENKGVTKGFQKE